MVVSTSHVKRVAGPNGASAVSFHTEWPLSMSEVLYKTGGFAPIQGDPDYRPIVTAITYASSF